MNDISKWSKMEAIVLCMAIEALVCFFSIPMRTSRTFQLFDQKIGSGNGKSIIFDIRMKASVYTLKTKEINDKLLPPIKSRD